MASYLRRVFQGLVGYDAPAGVVASQDERKPYTHGITGAILQQIFDQYCGPLERCMLMGTSREFCALVKRTRAYGGRDRIARLITGKFSEILISNPKSRWAFDDPPTFSTYNYDLESGVVITGDNNNFSSSPTDAALWGLKGKKVAAFPNARFKDIRFVHVDLLRERALIADVTKINIWDLKSGCLVYSKIVTAHALSCVYANFKTGAVFFGTSLGDHFLLESEHSYRLIGHISPIVWIEDDPSRNRCFNSSFNRMLTIWRRAENTRVKVFRLIDLPDKCAYDHSTGVLIAAAEHNTLLFIDAISGNILRVFTDSDKSSELSAFHYCSAAQKLLALFCYKKEKPVRTRVVIWDLTNKKSATSFPIRDTDTADSFCTPKIDFDHEHDLLLVERQETSKSPRLQFWDIKTGKLLHTIKKNGILTPFTWDKRRCRLIIFNQLSSDTSNNNTNSISLIDYTQPRLAPARTTRACRQLIKN